MVIGTQSKISGAFGAAAVISIVIGVVSYASVSRIREDAARGTRTEEVINALRTVQSWSINAQTAVRGFTITGNDAYLLPYNEAGANLDRELARLSTLTAGDGPQQQRLKSLAELVRERLGIAAEQIEARRTRGFEAARDLVAGGRGRQTQELLTRLVGEMIDSERSELSRRQAETDRASAAALRFAVAASVLGLVLALASQVLIRRDVAGARRAQAALREANETLELRVAQRTAELGRANERLSAAFEELHSLVEQAPLAIAMFDRDMRYIATSRRWVTEFGRGHVELVGLSHYDVHPDIPRHWIEVHRRALAGEVVKQDEELWVQADGSRHWLRWAVSPWRNEQGEVGGLTIFAEDITERKRDEARLRLADAVFQSTQEGIVVTDLAGNMIAVNPAFTHITEYSREELLGRNLRLLNSGRQGREFYREMWQSILATGTWQGELWDRRKSGEIFQQWVSISTLRDEAGQPTSYVGVFTDISRMRHAQSHLEYLAHHDELTGLPNRSLLFARLRHTVERARRDGLACAVLLLDLDNFKTVNDTLGHEAGDELLKLASDRIRPRLRDTDTIARLGGDEFALVLERVGGADNAAQVARVLTEQLAAPFRLGGGSEVHIGASIGISLFPADGDNAEDLLRSADAALYRAKAAGRGTWRFFDPEAARQAQPGQERPAPRPA
jgi:diguanylate cyclase (GGDEF)-like protein/PAS domain S-box-containing protein